MPGFVEFSKIRHFKDGKVSKFSLEIDGRTLLEYRGSDLEGRWSIIIPLLGTYWCDKNDFDPVYVDVSDWYYLTLYENDNTMSIIRKMR